MIKGPLKVLLHPSVSVSLGERLGISRLAAGNSDVSDEERPFGVRVLAVGVSNDVTASLCLREPVVDWVFEHDVVDPIAGISGSSLIARAFWWLTACHFWNLRAFVCERKETFTPHGEGRGPLLALIRLV